jgi:hypothetical protein
LNQITEGPPSGAQEAFVTLPTTLAASDSDGGNERAIVFVRHIVNPDGHREIEGATPKALPAPEPDETIFGTMKPFLFVAVMSPQSYPHHACKYENTTNTTGVA